MVRRRPSRIGVRLFAFNLLVLFVPVAAIFYLDVYEERLLDTQERGMVQQARLAAAALGTAAEFDGARAAAMLTALGQHTEARIRVFDVSGQVIADTARLGARLQPVPGEEYIQLGTKRSRYLYQLGARLVGIRDSVANWIWPRGPDLRVEPLAEGPPREVRTALAGRYGAAARQTAGQRSLTLNSAVPIHRNGSVAGAVVVSQSTFRILQALYEVRLRLFQIVLISLGVAALLTRIASSTIVNPIVRLARTAAALTARQTELSGRFAQVNRTDEIGDLARNLEALAERLDGQIKLLEAVAADVAHEFKNPLASIRTAAETIESVESAEDRQRFIRMLLRDVDRLEALVDGVREFARIDAELSTAERQSVDVVDLLRNIVTGRRMTGASTLHLQAVDRPVLVSGSRHRLHQLFENVVDNALSLSPADSQVDVRLTVTGGECVVVVADRGPGIPEAHMERIFERFFSYRPGSDRRSHMGLGLPIANRVATSYGGVITARNRPEGGAEFEIRLPLATIALGPSLLVRAKSREAVTS